MQAGDVIAEIETDKATMEVEAVDEGKLAKILVAEGTEGVKVNTPIAVLSAKARRRARARRRRRRPRQRRHPRAAPAEAGAGRRRCAAAPKADAAGRAGIAGRHRDGRP